MIEGITKDGYIFNIDDDLLDDYDFFEILTDAASDPTKIVTVLRKLFVDDENLEAFKKQIREKEGRVRFTRMSEIVTDIFSEIASGKKSSPSATL